ncbi:MAG: glutathione S-transferase family protein [Myxococcota bacterium]
MKPTLLSSLGSQHARRVRVLVHELQIDLDVEEVAFGPQGFGGDEREAFLAINPNGKVPVLKHGELILWESNAIMWYLAELSGDSPLWPRDAKERAAIAMWQVWQAAHLTPAADGLFYENRVKPMFMKTDPDAGQVQQLTESFHRWMGVLEHALAKSDYLALDRFTCADIAVAAALMQAKSSKMPLDEHPTVAAWFARVCERPSWIATEPPAMPPG